MPISLVGRSAMRNQTYQADRRKRLSLGTARRQTYSVLMRVVNSSSNRCRRRPHLAPDHLVLKLNLAPGTLALALHCKVVRWLAILVLLLPTMPIRQHLLAQMRRHNKPSRWAR